MLAKPDSEQFPKRKVYPAEGSCRGLFAVIHGLNQKPKVLEPLLAELTSLGFECHLLALAGHREGEYEQLKAMSSSVWKTEARNFLGDMQTEAGNRGLKYYTLGYSLGALLILESLRGNKELKLPERAIFFAPAFALHFYSALLKIVSPVLKRVPSLNPKRMRAVSGGLPIKAYLSLFQIVEDLQGEWPQRLSGLKSLIVVDPQDELVNYRGFLDLIQEKKWFTSEMVWIGIDRRVRAKYHHLIAAPDYIHKSQWDEIRRLLKNFLVTDSAESPDSTVLPTDFNLWLSQMYEKNWERSQQAGAERHSRHKALKTCTEKRGWCKPRYL